jgi:hypothetical protein
MPHRKLRGVETDDLNAARATISWGRRAHRPTFCPRWRTGHAQRTLDCPWAFDLEAQFIQHRTRHVDKRLHCIDFLFFHPFSSFLLFCINSGYQTEVSKFKPLQAVELKKKSKCKIIPVLYESSNTETRYAQLLPISRYKAITHQWCTIIANY